jgi:glycosyltransferase involved in cell wall biosynthesis
MRRLADGLIVYTEAEAAELRASSAGVDVVAAPNALYELHQMSPLPPSGEPSDFVFVGRLTSAKKPQLLLEGFREAAPFLETGVSLVFVGEGPLRLSLEQESVRAGLANRVRFLGHVSDPEELQSIYANAIASVSPGYAGLSLIQSLGFGIPMIIARDEPHAPEIEAAVEGENAMYFQQDTPAALKDLLLAVARDRTRWLARREQIGAPIRTRYSIEGMVESFVAALAWRGGRA